MTPEEQAAAEAKANEESKADEVPSWAQSLIDQNADLANRLASFEEKIQTPAVEPGSVAPEQSEAWKPASWQDVEAKAEEKAQQIVEQTLAQREEAVRSAQEAEAQSAQEVDAFLDAQVEELTKASQLPAVTNENDPNDPGKLAQRELFGFALSLGTADLKKSYEVLDNLHKSGKQFDFVKMELVDKNPASAGADVPVGSSSSGGAGGSNKPDYKTIHNMSLSALADRFSS